MAVTRSTPADRRRQQLRQPLAASPIPGLPGPKARRGRETVLLLAALAVVLFGFILVYRAATRSFGEVEEQRRTRQVLHLGELRQAEDLVPVLPPYSGPGERAFVAGRIWQRLAPGNDPLENVGELGRLRVSAAEIEDDGNLETLRERLEAAGGEGERSVRLLNAAQVRQVKPRLIVRGPDEFRSVFWRWAALFLAAFALVHAVWTLRGFRGDQLVLPAVLVLTGLGFMLMVSVRDPLRDMLLFRTFAQGVVLGCVLMLAASLVDWERSPLRRMTFAPLLGAVLLSVLLIVFGSGPGGSDAKVNLFGFQPVEIIKILVVLFLAGYFVERWEFLRELTERRPGLAPVARWLRIPKLEYVLPPIVAIGVVLFFFFLQKDLGPALVLSVLFFLLYSVARGGRPVMAAGGLLLLVAAFFVGYQVGYPRTVTGRIGMWLSPWDNTFRGGEHLAHSLWALAGGSLSGMGLGLGDPGRVPEAHTDMILAAIGEELGFLGLLAVFALYALLVARGFRIARRADGVYGFFLALGLTLVIALPILLIGGGVVGLFPLSGVVSPFLSFGRSAMIANFFILGMLLAISARAGDGKATQRFQGATKWVAVALAIPLAAIVARAAWVQVIRDDDVLTRGALTLQGDGWRRFQYNPRLADIADTIPRGVIYDRNGLPLAASGPRDLEKHRAKYAALGVTLAKDIEEGRRQYPFEGRTFHLLGDLRNRVNWAASNTSYAERDSRIRLQGYDDYAAVVQVRQPDGTMSDLIKFDYHELIPLLRHRYRPEHPDVKKVLERDRDVRMTIDVRLQLAVEEILERYAREVGRGAGASAVVMDVEKGDLLASAGYPWPRRLPVEDSEDARSEMIDRARYGIYPPGSTFKIVTAMAALRKDPAIAGRTFECKLLPDGRMGNRVRGWGRPVRDDPTVRSPHGVVNMEKGIGQSCNAYFGQLGTYEVGAERLHETAEAMGISVARPNTPEQLKDALPQSSYGQGQVTATPFQMARVAATVANGGAMPEGRWIVGESNPRKGEPVEVLPADSIALLARSMRRVVTNGTASHLSGVVPAIAGKTGTAEVQGKPSHSWFIGFAPYGTQGGRKIAFAVIVENGGYGGRVAAKAAGEIVQKAAQLGLIR
jgi:cell division protein FtsW (lipid II flippase)